MKYSNVMGFCIFILTSVMIYHGCSTSKKAKPCKQCPSYTKYWVQQDKIDSLERELAFCIADYDSLWEEQCIFSSVFAEIESEPGGSEILTKLWNEHNTK